MGIQLLRSSEKLVKPWKETPTETLELSGIDKLWILRCNARTLHVYNNNNNTKNDDVSVFDVVSEAVSKALVPYYPLAGRLTNDSSSVECNANGVLLVEASAACTLASSNLDSDESHQLLLPPIQTGPLLQMQVTQFSCGGFVLGLVFSHTVCDGLGAAQFLNAVGEAARSFPRLSVDPVWCRGFFTHNPPPPPPMMPPTTVLEELEHVKVEIKREEIEEAKRVIRHETGLGCSTFEIVAAALWRCRGRAGVKTNELAFFASCRHLITPSLPEGFYGNCFFPVRARESGDLAVTLGRAVELIQEAKAGLARGFGEYCREGNAEEFLRPPSYEALYVSEWGRLGFNQVDVGWGPPERVVPMQGAPGIPAAVITRGADDTVTVDTWCVRGSHLQHFLHALPQLFR